MEKILEMRNISKDFSGVYALKNVNFDAEYGEVHALVGENGAGKTTLMHILGGVHKKYSGDIIYEGNKIYFNSPAEAISEGIGIIYQELDLVSELTVGENIMLGKEPRTKIYGIDKKKIWKLTKEYIERLGFNLDPNQKVIDLSIGDKQLVQIVKAIYLSAKVIIMDEPTAKLDIYETEKLFKAIKRLKEKGLIIIYISHHLEEIFEIADRVTILRDGKVICTKHIENLSYSNIIYMMFGKNVNKVFARNSIWEEKNEKEKVLEIKNFKHYNDENEISFSLYKGEILGFAGSVGSGRTELMQLLWGFKQRERGEVFINDKEVNIRRINDAVDLGIAMIPEDRKSQGLVIDHSIGKNITIVYLRKIVRRFGFFSIKERTIKNNEMINKLQIKCTNEKQILKHLSGGNQQKVLMAKWLVSRPNILIMDQPTRGIDVASKEEVYKIVNKLSSEGNSIIFISDDLPELLHICDRIFVVKKGRIKREYFRKDFNEKEILNCMLE